MHKLLTIVFLCTTLCAIAQKQMGLEHYYFMQQQQQFGTVIPKINYQSAKGWYTEARYNWEELQTASLHFGKNIGFKKLEGLEVTPVAGICFGKLNGGSMGVIMEYNWNRLFFSSEPQFVFAFNGRQQNYLYSWSEALYEIRPFFYGGLAVQHTKAYDNNFIEPGIVAGITVKNVDIPLYCFQPLGSNRNFVVGISWKWKKS